MRLIRLSYVLVFFWPCASAQETPRQTQAQTAALVWLGLVDAGDYTHAWENAAAFFRGKITQKVWASRASAARRPFGAVQVRSPVPGRYSPSILHGPPGSEFVIFFFTTTFAHQGLATEIVIPVKDADGEWHVSAYGFIPRGCVEPIPQTSACGANNLYVGIPEVGAL